MLVPGKVPINVFCWLLPVIDDYRYVAFHASCVESVETS